MSDDAIQNEGVGGGTGSADSSETHLLTRFLSDRDQLCPFCGHNLRCLQSDRCSECGTRLTLRVVAQSCPMKLWIACLTLLVFGTVYLSFFASFSVSAMIDLHNTFYYYGGWYALLCCIFPFLCGLCDIYLSILLITYRTRFFSCSYRKRKCVFFVLVAALFIQISVSALCLYALNWALIG